MSIPDLEERRTNPYELSLADSPIPEKNCGLDQVRAITQRIHSNFLKVNEAFEIVMWETPRKHLVALEKHFSESSKGSDSYIVVWDVFIQEQMRFNQESSSIRRAWVPIA
jgi:hypothetical protein